MRNITGLLLKIVMTLVLLLVVIIAGFYIYVELTKRPPGSPPPGYEDRVKYERGAPGPYSSKIVSVDLWFGRRDGEYDTTHLRVNSDYLTMRPNYHGQAAAIMLVWPSMLSNQGYGKMLEREGLTLSEKRKQLTLTFSEVKLAGSGDQNIGDPFRRCKPITYDEMRGVKYCSKIRKTEASTDRLTHYLPLDESLRTPWYKNPPAAHCHVIERQGGSRFDACSIRFSYNADVVVDIDFLPEKLTIEIITDFARLTDFLGTLEVKQEIGSDSIYSKEKIEAVSGRRASPLSPGRPRMANQ
jgi:hypothetical protein